MSVNDRKGRADFTIVWKVENFSFNLQKSLEYLKSPSFAVDLWEETHFCLELCPKSEGGCIGVYIRRTNSDGGPDRIKFSSEISLLNDKGQPLHCMSNLKFSFDRGVSSMYGLPEFISREVLAKKLRCFLAKGTLTVCCRIWKTDSEPTGTGQCILRTHIGVERRAFNWDIEEFSNLLPEHKSVTVDSLSKQHPSFTMKLILHPGLMSGGKFQLQLIQVDCNKENLMACKVYVFNEQKKAVMRTEDEHLFQERRGRQIWHFPLFIKQSDLMCRKNTLLPNDVLTLYCEYSMSIGTTLEEVESHIYGPTSFVINSESHGFNYYDNEPKDDMKDDMQRTHSLKDDMQSMYETEDLCDIKLETDDETFTAHKVILSARSPVFKAMFTNRMKENTSGCVQIPDIDPDTVEQMLMFIYTDKVDDLDDEMAPKLYFAADKYQLESLKKLCSSYLTDNLSPSNACEVLILADVHGDINLKRAAEDFVFLHDNEIIRSNEWKSLMETNTQLAAEIMHNVFLKKS